MDIFRFKKLTVLVKIFDMQVNPNDLIHADLHGAIVIKRHKSRKIA